MMSTNIIIAHVLGFLIFAAVTNFDNLFFLWVGIVLDFLCCFYIYFFYQVSSTSLWLPYCFVQLFRYVSEGLSMAVVMTKNAVMVA